MGDPTITSQPYTPVDKAQVCLPTDQVADPNACYGPEDDAATVAAPPATTDEAKVASKGSSAATVSLMDAPAATAVVDGAFAYNDKAIALFNQFAANGKVFAGRIPVLSKSDAEAFSKELLTKIAQVSGQADLVGQLDHADAIKTLQQIVGARTDGRFGPETLFKTVQAVQTKIQEATTPEALLAAKQVVGAFGGKVRGLDDLLAAQTLRVGEAAINGAKDLNELKQVATRIQPLLDGNPTLASILANKQTGLQAEADRAAAAAKAQEEAAHAAAEAERAKAAEAAAEAQKKAKEAAEAQALKERQGAIDVAMTPVKGSSKDDDTARYLVSKGYNKDATTSQKTTLINAMLDGATGDDDEKAIIAILKDDIAANKINETLTALGKKRVEQLFDDIDGKENDQLLSAIYTAPNISKEHLNAFTAHIVSEEYEGKLVDLAKGKRGQLSDAAAPIVLNHLLKVSPSGKDEAIRALRTRIGMEGLVTGKVNMGDLYRYMGKDKEKAQFVVDILKTADSLQQKINNFAVPDTPDTAQRDKFQADLKALTDARDYALGQAKAAISHADDDQTVEFMKLMVGDSKSPHSLKSFASLPDPLLAQLYKNLDSFWNNTWKTDEEKAYRQIIEDAQAVKRRAAFGSDGDASAVPGSAATGYNKPAAPVAPIAPPRTEADAKTTDAHATGFVPPAGAEQAEHHHHHPRPDGQEAVPVQAPPPGGKNPEIESGQPGSYVPGAAASTATTVKKSPNND